MSANTLLISIDMLKQRTSIHDNIDPKLIYPEIKAAQDMYIHPILGTSLYNKIVSDVGSATISGVYKSLLDDYIVDALCWFVVSAIPEIISFQFYNKGVVRKSGDNTELPTMSDLVSISDKYRVRAEWYAERLNKYLKQNATSSNLQEYWSPGAGLDTIVPEANSYSMPVYLGGQRSYSMDKNNCHCNEQTGNK